MGFFSQPAAPNVGQEFSKIMSLIQQDYPNLLSEQNAGMASTAQAELGAQQQTAAPLAQLMQSIYSTYGPQLAKTGLGIGQQIQQGQAGANAAVANSSQGQAALQAAINADMAANPQFYAARAQEGNALGTLLGADTSAIGAPLGPTVMSAIGQSVAQQGNQTGTVNTPSAIQTASNAMQYGQAGYNQQEQAKTDLGNAIGSASSFLPASQSGVGGTNAFNIATGGSSTATGTANNSLGMFTGTNSTGTNSAAGTAGSTLSGALGAGTSLANTASTANASQDSPYQALTGFL